MPTTLPTPLQGKKQSELTVVSTLPAGALVNILDPGAPAGSKNKMATAAAFASGPVLDSGTTLHFNHSETMHPVVLTGTFTADTSAIVAGSSEVIVLGPGATLPTLDPAIFRTISTAPAGPAASGHGWEYAFKVRYDGQHIDYLITEIEL